MNLTQGVKTIMPKHKINYNSWPLDCLANYIEKLQHKTITDKSKSILQNMTLVKSSCTIPNNYFMQLEDLFTESVNRLSAHMKKEEQHLFPFINEMMQAKELNRGINRIALDKIEWLIELLNDEHAIERKRLKSGAELRANCIAISNVNRPLNTLLTGLAEFEEACELHIDLQYKFLFPKILIAKYAVA